jgi:hypothetical protein
VKAGHPEALALLGFAPAQVRLEDFTLTPPAIQLGEGVTVSFTLHNETAEAQQLVVDYAVHFVRANGSSSPKVFKLKTAVLPPHAALPIRKTHKITPITTRRYYPGVHRLEIQVNGQVLQGGQFELLT